MRAILTILGERDLLQDTKQPGDSPHINDAPTGLVKAEMCELDSVDAGGTMRLTKRETEAELKLEIEMQSPEAEKRVNVENCPREEGI